MAARNDCVVKEAGNRTPLIDIRRQPLYNACDKFHNRYSV